MLCSRWQHLDPGTRRICGCVRANAAELRGGGCSAGLSAIYSRLRHETSVPAHSCPVLEPGHAPPSSTTVNAQIDRHGVQVPGRVAGDTRWLPGAAQGLCPRGAALAGACSAVVDRRAHCRIASDAQRQVRPVANPAAARCGTRTACACSRATHSLQTCTSLAHAILRTWRRRGPSAATGAESAAGAATVAATCRAAALVAAAAGRALTREPSSYQRLRSPWRCSLAAAAAAGQSANLALHRGHLRRQHAACSCGLTQPSSAPCMWEASRIEVQSN